MEEEENEDEARKTGEVGANFGASTLFNVYSFETPNMRRKHGCDYAAGTRASYEGTARRR